MRVVYKKCSNKGFTLIELLAVIIIMGIIMLVGIPATIKIIENSRKEVFEKSVGGIARSALLETKSNAVDGEELTYKYENGYWGEIDLEIDGEIPKYVEIKVKDEKLCDDRWKILC